MDAVRNHPGDSVAIPGIRSDPRRLAQVASDAMHARDEPKHAVSEVKPGAGVRSFHADPSTPVASESFDPLSQAEKYVHHLAQSSVGAIGQAVDGATVHDHGSHHGIGSWVQSFGGKHKVLAGMVGALLSAFDGKHSVTADAGGLSLKSATSIGLDCPAGGLSLPAGGVGSSALASGAASSNVGSLSGDLAGSLPNPTVTNLHVDFSKLPAATSDGAAALAGVGVGGLYRDTGVAAGKSYLAVRMA